MGHSSTRARWGVAAAAVAMAGALAAGPAAAGPAPEAILEGRAVLPALTFATGPRSGSLLGPAPVNGVTPPFAGQPVQGFSGVLDNRDGTFWAMADNGFGALENSADFELRMYRVRPDLRTGKGGSGEVEIEGRIRLRDPDGRVPFAIVNQFSRARVLTGADFDIESVQRAPDGTLWFGDEFGPFLLHTDAGGKVLEPPVPLPDADTPGREVRAPQNPFNEESGAVRVMNAFRADARRHGGRDPVFSPSYQLLKDGDPADDVESRTAPPAGSGLQAASSEIFDVGLLKAAGFPVVPYTVNDTPTMLALMKLGVSGLISDRPDLVRAAVKAFDANGDGTPGDLIGPDGLVDATRLDVQGHRGARDLRPENTLPAMEAGLDQLVTTLETDAGVTRDGQVVLSHDPYVQATKCRRTDGAPYAAADDVLIRTLTLAEIQAGFVCDKVFRGPTQQNDRALSPVAVAFAAQAGLPDPYAMPTLQQLFDFARFYADWYRTGPGTAAPDAELRWRNAERVRFNIETKVNPRTDEDPLGNVQRERTIGPAPFARALAGVIVANGLQARADIQSFDFRTLLVVQHEFPDIRTVYLFGDFPTFADPTLPGSDDGTNLQPQGGDTTPWMAGVPWPYRVTAQAAPFRAQRSGGFEGMAITPDGRTLLPLLEKPLAGDPPNTLRISEFDIATGAYTGRWYVYPLDARGTSIGDFVVFSPTEGLVIERDGSQGDLGGFKTVQRVTLGAPGEPVAKSLAVDLMRIRDPFRLSQPGRPGDVGIGPAFAFPFETIEDVAVLGPRRILVINDNNFPFSVGRHVGAKAPDDTEMIVLRLDRRLTGKGPATK